MIIYILFLPDTLREEIFEGTDMPGDISTSPSEEITDILLEKHVGRLEFFPPGPIEHPLTSIHLFRTTKSSVVEEFNPFTAEMAAFSGQAISKTFSLSSLGNTDNVLLTFDAPIREGRLNIYLNGQLLSQLQPHSALPSPEFLV